MTSLFVSVVFAIAVLGMLLVNPGLAIVLFLVGGIVAIRLGNAARNDAARRR